MTIQPPPEQFAREILTLFIHQQKMSVGDSIPAHDALVFWQKNQHRADDFRAGIGFALDNGWIEIRRDSLNWFHLTEKGYAEVGNGCGQY
jgi:hypothetical protein